MTVPIWPIFLTDMGGALLMIVFSFLCLRVVHRINRTRPGHLVWTYLLWVSVCLAGFAVSRSAGHILKQFLILSDQAVIWGYIRPYSGTINTFLLIIVAAVTLFFERIWRIYGQNLRDQQALQKAHTQLLSLNENLERRVRERSEALARHEKEMAQADRLASIGQLSSGIAHEINNPLGIILGYAQLMLRDEEVGSQKYEDLKIIEKHVKNCKTIVEDLLSFARNTQTRQDHISLHEMIDQVVTFIRQHARPDSVTIEREYDEDVPEMVMDEKKIKQVLVNLIMNARHATGTEGKIHVSTRFDTENQKVAIRIEDTGYGIEKKNLSRIFDPFFTTKPTGEGTGLGLAVSYGIIKNHGGDIAVESEPGRGSVFTILLPAVKGNDIQSVA